MVDFLWERNCNQPNHSTMRKSQSVCLSVCVCVRVCVCVERERGESNERWEEEWQRKIDNHLGWGRRETGKMWNLDLAPGDLLTNMKNWKIIGKNKTFWNNKNYLLKQILYLILINEWWCYLTFSCSHKILFDCFWEMFIS